MNWPLRRPENVVQDEVNASQVIDFDPKIANVREQTLKTGKRCVVCYTVGSCHVARDMRRMMHRASVMPEYQSYAFIHVNLDEKESSDAARNVEATGGMYCTQLWVDGSLVRSTRNPLTMAGHLEIFVNG